MIRWAIRLAQWFRHPPSPRQAALALAVIAFCLLVAGFERLWGWPDWLRPDPAPRIVR